MHRDPSTGVWHANITVFGRWHGAIGYTLDWLATAPAAYAPRHRMVERGGPWFMLVDLDLPVSEARPVPVALHVAAVTGTWGSQDIEDHLFACADLVIFFAEMTADQVELAAFVRPALDRWVESRGDTALVVAQLDRVDYARVPEWKDPPPQLEAAEVRERLALARWPYHVTTAYNRDHAELAPLFRTAVATLLDNRDRLPPHPDYAAER